MSIATTFDSAVLLSREEICDALAGEPIALATMRSEYLRQLLGVFP